MMLETIPNALPLAKSGQMRAIAVTTKERSAAAPDIPTLAKSGLPGFDVSAWTGFFVPAGTPEAVIDRLNAETQRISGDSHYVELVHNDGYECRQFEPAGVRRIRARRRRAVGERHRPCWHSKIE